MGSIHTFHNKSSWSSGLKGDGSADVTGTSIPFGVPASMGGDAGRTNPEELLLASVSACYCITLGILTERKRISVKSIVVDAEGTVESQLGGTLKYTAIVIRATIVAESNDETIVRTLTDLAYKAEQYCPISSALKGNVEISVEPSVVSG